MKNAITRRRFLRMLAGLPFLTVLPVPSMFRSADAVYAATGTPIGERFSGEELYFDIFFSLLGRVATVKMTFTPGDEKGRYVCSVQGETVGLVGFATRYRKDTYRAVMEELDSGTRLRSLLFEEQVRIGSKSRRRTNIFDHGSRKWIERNVRKSGATSETVREIPEGRDYNDFLTAAYNFRYGVYGKPEKGKTYRVPVFPKKDVSSYDVRIASAAEEDKLRKRKPVRDGGEFRIEVTMDPEVLDSTQGKVKGWLSRDLYPVEGIIEDVFLFGDVRGTLVKRRGPSIEGKVRDRVASA